MRMIRKLGWTLGAAIMASPGYAADLPVKAPPRVEAARIYSWTGFYIGAHVGYGWGRTHTTNVNGTAPFPAGTTGQTDLNGIFGGGQVGFNYQVDRVVFGVEAEFSASDVRGDRVRFSDVPGFTTTRLQTAETKLKNFTTVAGRLGYANGNWLFYGKGGAVWSESDTHAQTVNPEAGNAINSMSNGNETRFGWLGGAGIEWGFASNWSAKIEYNYMDFGTERVERHRTFGTGPDPLLRDVNLRVQTVKFGLNYRFDFAQPLVAARY